MQKELYRIANALRKAYWRTFKPETFGVKVVLSKQDDPQQILLVRHAYGNRSVWNIPGGGYSPKRESAEVAAAREMKEELALQNLKFLKIGSYTSDAEGKKDVVTIFATPVLVDEVKPRNEVSEARWFSISDPAVTEHQYRITRYAVNLYKETLQK